MDRSAISKVIPVVLIVVVVVVVGAVGLVLFSLQPLGLPSSSPPEPEIREPPEVPIEPVPGEVPEPGGEVRPRPGQDPLEPLPNRVSLTLTGMNVRWVMNGVENPRIELPQGSIVEIDIINDDNVPHQFAIDGLNIGANRINPGESVTISFGVPRAGTFQYRCVIHPVVMDGEIVVTPESR